MNKKEISVQPITVIPNEDYNDIVFMAWCLGIISSGEYRLASIFTWDMRKDFYKLYFYETIGVSKYKELYEVYYDGKTSSLIHRLRKDLVDDQTIITCLSGSRFSQYAETVKKKFMNKYIEEAENLRLILKYIVNEEQ